MHAEVTYRTQDDMSHEPDQDCLFIFEIPLHSKAEYSHLQHNSVFVVYELFLFTNFGREPSKPLRLQHSRLERQDDYYKTHTLKNDKQIKASYYQCSTPWSHHAPDPPKSSFMLRTCHQTCDLQPVV